MPYNRTDRINGEIQRELSDIIRSGLKNPNIAQICSITKCETTRDLRHCNVYISVFSSPEETAATFETLRKSAGFLRRELGARMSIRYTPELHFIPDDTIEHSIHISQILKDLNKDRDTDDAN